MNLYEITVIARFLLLDESEIAAEELAQKMIQNASDEMPGNVTLDCSASQTRNQSDEIKSSALNKDT